MTKRTAHLIRSHGYYTSLRPYLRDCERYITSHPFNMQRAIDTNLMLLPAKISVDSRTNLDWQLHAAASEVFNLKRDEREQDASAYFHRLKQAQLFQQHRRQHYSHHDHLHLPHVHAYYHSHSHSNHSHSVSSQNHHLSHHSIGHSVHHLHSHGHNHRHHAHPHRGVGDYAANSSASADQSSPRKEALNEPLFQVLPPLIQAVSQSAVYRPVAAMFEDVHVENDKLLSGPQKAQRGQVSIDLQSLFRPYPSPVPKPRKISDNDIVFGSMSLPYHAGWQKSRIEWLLQLER